MIGACAQSLLTEWPSREFRPNQTKWALEPIGYIFHWRFGPIETLQPVCNGGNLGLLLPRIDSPQFFIFLQPILAAPAGQTTECRFLTPLFESGNSAHSFYTTHEVDRAATLPPHGERGHCSPQIQPRAKMSLWVTGGWKCE